jgi:hypothetical protein
MDDVVVVFFLARTILVYSPTGTVTRFTKCYHVIMVEVLYVNCYVELWYVRFCFGLTRCRDRENQNLMRLYD